MREESTPSAELDHDDHRISVRERYASIATEGATCCGDSTSPSQECCGPEVKGYTSEDLEAVAVEMNLGCGNPVGLASLDDGDTVLDLGSGAGFDCFIAAQAVGEEGTVIGVDMTTEMVDRARSAIDEHNISNVEFRLGEIEQLPVADASVDVIISNCVVNLSPDKPQVFAEAFRVLRPGGRLAIADVVSMVPLPPSVRGDPTSLAACIAGASTVSELESMLVEAGFTEITVEPQRDSETFITEWDVERDLSEYIVSAHIEGRKPDTASSSNG